MGGECSIGGVCSMGGVCGMGGETLAARASNPPPGASSCGGPLRSSLSISVRISDTWLGFWFQISGLRFPVSGFRFSVSGFRGQDSGFIV